MGPSVCVCVCVCMCENMKHESADTKPTVHCSAVYLHLAECAMFQTHLPLLFLAFFFSSFFFSKQFRGELLVLRRGCRLKKNTQKKRRRFLTVQTVSHLVSLEVERDVCITQSPSLPLVFSSFCVRLPVTLTSSSPLSPLLSPLLHISVSFCFSYLLCPSSGTACPPKGFTVPVSLSLRCFSPPSLLLSPGLL